LEIEKGEKKKKPLKKKPKKKLWNLIFFFKNKKEMWNKTKQKTKSFKKKSV